MQISYFSLFFLFVLSILLSEILEVYCAPEKVQVMIPLYKNGELLGGFEDRSWGSVNLKSSKQHLTGSDYSISFQDFNYTAVYLHGHVGYESLYLQTLSFYIYGEGPGPKLSVKFMSNGKLLPQSLDISNEIQMNAWKKVTIQMSTFGFSPTLILDSVWFESASKENSGTVYLDEIKFTAVRQWNLVWQDEFDTFNEKTWTKLLGTHGPSSYEKEHYIPEDAYVESGKLVLRTRKNKYENYNFTSGWVDTKQKWSHTYGRWEFSAKLPFSKALWPAIWLMPAWDVCWPRGGEIDIMELLGQDPRKVMAHYHYALEECGHSKELSDGGAWIAAEDTYKDFHLYALEWEKDRFNFFFDNIKYRTIWNGDNNLVIPSKPFYIILNTAIGGWPGNPNNNTILPQYNYIDFVRVYDAA